MVHTGAHTGCTQQETKTLKRLSYYVHQRLAAQKRSHSSAYVNRELNRSGVRPGQGVMFMGHCILVQLAQHSHWSGGCFAAVALLRRSVRDRAADLLEEAREFGALPPHPTGGSVAEESFAGALGSVKTFMPFMAAISRRSCAPKRFAFCIKRTCLRFSSDIPQTLQCPRHIRKECPGLRLEDTAVQHMQQTVQSPSMSSFFKTARIARRVVCTSRRCLRRTSTVKAWGEAFMERRRTFGGIPSEGQGKHPS